MKYKEAYAIVIAANNMTREEHHSLQEFISHHIQIINGFTPYEAYIDLNYSDDTTPYDTRDSTGDSTGDSN